MKTWNRSSWREKPIKQQPTYPDQAVLEQIESQLRNYQIGRA